MLRRIWEIASRCFKCIGMQPFASLCDWLADAWQADTLPKVGSALAALGVITLGPEPLPKLLGGHAPVARPFLVRIVQQGRLRLGLRVNETAFRDEAGHVVLVGLVCGRRLPNLVGLPKAAATPAQAPLNCPGQDAGQLGLQLLREVL